ncbi:hypothetical protein Hanom_Chr09g00805021 [Helianthus anomalus]
MDSEDTVNLNVWILYFLKLLFITLYFSIICYPTYFSEYFFLTIVLYIKRRMITPLMLLWESMLPIQAKAVAESMDDNVITPLVNILEETDIATKEFGEPAISKRRTRKPSFKKNLVGSYEMEEKGALSTTKTTKPGKPSLLTPKIEK